MFLIILSTFRDRDREFDTSIEKCSSEAINLFTFNAGTLKWFSPTLGVSAWSEMLMPYYTLLDFIQLTENSRVHCDCSATLLVPPFISSVLIGGFQVSPIAGNNYQIYRTIVTLIVIQKPLSR